MFQEQPITADMPDEQAVAQLAILFGRVVPNEVPDHVALCAALTFFQAIATDALEPAHAAWLLRGLADEFEKSPGDRFGRRAH